MFFSFELRRGQADPCVFVDLRAQEAGGRMMHEQLLGAFDAKCAQCSSPKDRDLLLAIVESSFGSLQHFNRIVRSMRLSGESNLDS